MKVLGKDFGFGFSVGVGVGVGVGIGVGFGDCSIICGGRLCGCCLAVRVAWDWGWG